MEHGQESSDSAVLRRRRRITRAAREKTPEPGRKYSDEYSESSSTFDPIQTVRMQIRPPGVRSAHESKILRRRDKTFASAAARSHSQPRQAERLSSPEAFELLRTVEKRSLSSPRHKEESSEGEHYPTTPEILERYPVMPTKEDDNLTRLEQNLRRFEDERRRFELEKRIFEKEKREHKVRYKQYLDNEERKQLMENYRKLSDRIQLPTDADERRRMVHSLRLSRNEAPVRLKPKKPSGYESSTQLSSSESEAVHIEQARKNRPSPPIQATAPPPPPVPLRRSASRNNSLSPIRPARRSKTPDTGSNSPRKASIENGTQQNLERKRSFEGKPVVQSLERKRSFEDKLEGQNLERKRSFEGKLEVQNLERKRSLNGFEAKFHQSSTKDNETPNLERKRSQRSSGVVQEHIQQDADKTEKARKLSIEKAEALKLVRKRSLSSSIKPKDDVKENHENDPQEKVQKVSIITRLKAFLKRPKSPESDSHPPPERLVTKAFIKQMFSELRCEWIRLKADYPQELDAMRKIRNKCFSHMIMLVLLCGFGGLIFRYTEGSFENIYKCEVRKVKRDFIDYLWTVSHNMREDDWKSAARTRLRKFEEELHAMQELGVRRFPGMKSWNFVNCVLYCWTVITTIGYGHITPQTTLGRSLTVIYSIIGIPMFLILLADFGKLFTRAIKFIWAYVRRIYYTGTCRQVRKQQQVLDVISGFNTMYDYAVRRPSQYIYGYPTDEEAAQPGQPGLPPQTDGKLAPLPQTPLSHVPSHPETPTSPYPETFEIDDEFNLPISLASIILISYIVIGAFVYTMWEDWTYFEAFYFVFISMSTIGFGDFVPNHPIFMMCSIIYLIFGLALTSMFINVVQIKLSDTFKDASAKIGATIGLTMAEGSESHVPTPTDIASIHIPKLDTIGEDLNEELSPSEHLRPPQPVNYEPGPPPLLPKKSASLASSEPEEKPKKKKGFFRK